jgi:ABC-type polysaccharide/polyol phosphate transport system ATPase subunit
MSAAISLKGVGMRFAVSPVNDRSIQGIFRTLRHRQKKKHVDAVKDITLELGRGERVGLIGPNGAGKSTLLKIMGGIYHPTSGAARIEGRVCPMFEFATGFEMDLSGWDNIRIRCMLLGMKRAEIEARLPEIAAFSGLGEFLDYPVRTYSVGMFVRLAFSASTAVSPQILLLDEVMGAGDLDFTAKARRRMLDFIEQGEIVVMASHILEQLRDLCQKVVWLDHGSVRMVGPSADVITEYQRSVA